MREIKKYESLQVKYALRWLLDMVPRYQGTTVHYCYFPSEIKGKERFEKSSKMPFRRKLLCEERNKSARLSSIRAKNSIFAAHGTVRFAPKV